MYGLFRIKNARLVYLNTSLEWIPLTLEGLKNPHLLGPGIMPSDVAKWLKEEPTFLVKLD